MSYESESEAMFPCSLYIVFFSEEKRELRNIIKCRR